MVIFQHGQSIEKLDPEDYSEFRTPNQADNYQVFSQYAE
jgi:hypothetical protein